MHWITFSLACLVIGSGFSAAEPSIVEIFGEHWRLLDYVSHGDSTLRMRITFSGPSTLMGGAYRDGDWVGKGVHILGGAEAGAEGAVGGMEARILPLTTSPSVANLGFIMDPGPQRLVVLAAGAIDKVEYTIEGSASYQVVAEGVPQTLTGEEMEGRVWAKGQGANAMVHVAVDRALTFEVNHRIWGAFGLPLVTGEYAGMTLRSDTTVDNCGDPRIGRLPGPLEGMGRCYFHEIDGPGARGPGAYRLEWTGAGVAYGNIPVAAWADLPWPT